MEQIILIVKIIHHHHQVWKIWILIIIRILIDINQMKIMNAVHREILETMNILISEEIMKMVIILKVWEKIFIRPVEELIMNKFCENILNFWFTFLLNILILLFKV